MIRFRERKIKLCESVCKVCQGFKPHSADSTYLGLSQRHFIYQRIIFINMNVHIK